MKGNKIYWICQICGWFSMVAIETINYTFFIVGKFSLSLLWILIAYAITGIILTHLYRYFLLKRNFFEKASIRIWISAFLSTIIIATILSLMNFIPTIYNRGFRFVIQNIRFIDIAGTIINWMRYAGVWVIIYFMFKLLQKNNAIQQEKLKIENLARTTELELLKTQLNPHFLFNALNSIKALVIINPEQSRDAIVKLSELLRFTLQYGRAKLILLADEITEVKKYLELEKLRFGDRLQVQYLIGQDTLSQPIPPAIILTLAENAIKHGIAKQVGDCNVIINSSIDKGHLLIQVSNTGVLNKQETNGIGLKHIEKRLEEVFHHMANFSIEQKNENVITTIQTPLSWQ